MRLKLEQLRSFRIECGTIKGFNSKIEKPHAHVNVIPGLFQRE